VGSIQQPKLHDRKPMLVSKFYEVRFRVVIQLPYHLMWTCLELPPCGCDRGHSGEQNYSKWPWVLGSIQVPNQRNRPDRPAGCEARPRPLGLGTCWRLFRWRRRDQCDVLAPGSESDN
jgi:hypothetical protein